MILILLQAAAIFSHAQPFVEGQTNTGQLVTLTLVAGAYPDQDAEVAAGAKSAFEMTISSPGTAPVQLDIERYKIDEVAVSGSGKGPLELWSYRLEVVGSDSNANLFEVGLTVNQGCVTRSSFRFVNLKAVTLTPGKQVPFSSIGFATLTFRPPLGIGHKAAFTGATTILPSSSPQLQLKHVTWDGAFELLGRRMSSEYGMNPALFAAVEKARLSYIDTLRSALISPYAKVDWGGAVLVAIEPHFLENRQISRRETADRFVVRLWVSSGARAKFSGPIPEQALAFSPDGTPATDCNNALMP